MAKIKYLYYHLPKSLQVPRDCRFGKFAIRPNVHFILPSCTVIHLIIHMPICITTSYQQILVKTTPAKQHSTVLIELFVNCDICMNIDGKYQKVMKDILSQNVHCILGLSDVQKSKQHALLKVMLVLWLNFHLEFQKW